MAGQIVGIDIGSAAVKMAVCNGSRVGTCVSEPLPENMVSEGRILSPNALGDFLAEMRRNHKIMCRDAAIILLGNEVYFRQISVPPMSQEQLKINLPYEFHDYISGEKDKYYYDYAVTEKKFDEDGELSEIELVAAATSKENIEEYREMLRRAGMKLQVAIPEEMVWSNLLRLAEKEEAGREYAIMDIGHTAVRLHLYHSHKLEMTKEIETAGAVIDMAIAQARGVDEFIARTYKETGFDNVLTLEECQSVYGGISIEVMKALNYHSYEHRDNNLETVYYCGGGAHIEPLIEAISENVSLSLRPLNELLPIVSEEFLGCASAIGVTQQ